MGKRKNIDWLRVVAEVDLGALAIISCAGNCSKPPFE